MTKPLSWIRDQIQRQVSSSAEPLLLLGSSPDPATQQDKRELEDPPMPPSKRPRQTPSASTVTSVEIMEFLQFNPGDCRCLNWLDFPMMAAASNEGTITASKGQPLANDLVALATGNWLSDLIIDSYMSLICHHGNGHFDTADADVERPGSPRWHSWSTWFVSQLIDGGRIRRQWPPVAYPDAKIGDVMHHIFPLHLNRNHWGIIVLYKYRWRTHFKFFFQLEWL